MFKYIHKITSYEDQSRIDFNLSKRKRNFRFKDKVLYLKDQTILYKCIDVHKYYSKNEKACIGYDTYEFPNLFCDTELYQDLKSTIEYLYDDDPEYERSWTKYWYKFNYVYTIFMIDNFEMYKEILFRKNNLPNMIDIFGNTSLYKNGIEVSFLNTNVQ